MRDCVAFVRSEENETHFENVAREDVIVGNQLHAENLSSVLLRNPDVYVVPEWLESNKLFDKLLIDITQNERCVISKIAANNAIEVVLRMMKKTSERKALLQQFKIATCQRLVRRLCDACKQPVQPNPNFLKQLGAKPGDEVNVCNPYQLPPPSQQVDEKGNPIELPVCELCSGLGYIGRIAVVETLALDDELRKAFLTAPKIDQLAALARKRGNLPMVQQGYRLVLAGITSLQEVQRVFAAKKKT